MSDYYDLVHLPADASAKTLDYLRWIKDNRHRALGFGVPQIAGYIPNVMPGHIAMVQGQTAHGKTLVLNHIARHNLGQLVEREGYNTNRILPYVSVEENLQEMTLKELSWRHGIPMEKLSMADVDIDDLALKAGKLPKDYPLVRIAVDMMGKVAPAMPLSVIRDSLRRLVKDGKEIIGVIVDYLHALPLDPANLKMRGIGADGQRKLQIRDDVYTLREMGNEFQCPVFVGGQCKQHLEGTPDRGVYLPGIYDGSDAKDIGDRFDRIWSVWIPNRHYPVNTTVTALGDTWTVTDNLLLMWVCKQKGGFKSGKIFPLKINGNGSLSYHGS